jgi:hypothetical protein
MLKMAVHVADLLSIKQVQRGPKKPTIQNAPGRAE